MGMHNYEYMGTMGMVMGVDMDVGECVWVWVQVMGFIITFQTMMLI
jgi:hypothetical protein